MELRGRRVLGGQSFVMGALVAFVLAAALANLGRIEEARSEVAAGLAFDPQFTIANFRSFAWSDNPVYLAQGARLVEDMRRAGVPEQ